MDSDSSIGNVDTYYLETTDNLGETVQTNLSKSFTINPSATYAQVDTASRQIAALTKNDYADTILLTKISVNEVMAM